MSRSAAETAVPPTAPHAAVTAVRRASRSGHFWGVAGLTAAVAALQGAFGVQQYHRFRLGGYDLVIFDQAIRNYAHGAWPVSVFKDVHDAAQVDPTYSAPFTILGDHFSPIFVLLAPLYWIWNNPQVLLLAQAALFGLAVPPVWVFARRALRRIASPRFAAIAAYLITATFGLSWPLQEATQAGFHEVAFFVPLSALMIERLQAGRLKHAVACAVVLLFVKEDMGYVVAAFGLILLLTRKTNGVRLDHDALRRYRITGAVLIVGGIAFAMAVLHLWIPAFGGRPGFYWYYGQLGPNMPDALKTLVTNPSYAYQVATQPHVKVHTLFFLFWPYLYLSLASPICLLAAPLLAERLFSDKPEHWGLDQHYNAFLAAILIMAAVDGLVRLSGAARLLRVRWRGRAWRPTPRLGRWTVLAWSTAILVFAVVIIHTFPIRSVFDGNQWSDDDFTGAEAAAVAMIPSGTCVEADNNIATHLTSRTQVLLLDQVPRGCPWVVLQTFGGVYPMSDPVVVSERALWLRANGYVLVYSQAQVFVFHRT